MTKKPYSLCCDCPTASKAKKAVSRFSVYPTKSTNGKTCDFCGFYVVAIRHDAIEETPQASERRLKTVCSYHLEGENLNIPKSLNKAPLTVITPDGTELIYNSVKKAIKDLKISQAKIYLCCKTGETWKGYKFVREGGL